MKTLLIFVAILTSTQALSADKEDLVWSFVNSTHSLNLPNAHIYNKKEEFKKYIDHFIIHRKNSSVIIQ